MSGQFFANHFTGLARLSSVVRRTYHPEAELVQSSLIRSREEAAMATPYPSPDGHDRRSRWGRVIRTTFNVVGVSAFAAAPVAAVSLWLLLTDPLVAGEVATTGSVFPVVRTLVIAVGHALAAVLAYL